MYNDDIWMQIAQERAINHVKAQADGRVLMGQARRKLSVRRMIATVGHRMIEFGFKLESADPESTAVHHHHVHLNRPHYAAK